jgi:hypothetical protein
MPSASISGDGGSCCFGAEDRAFDGGKSSFRNGKAAEGVWRTSSGEDMWSYRVRAAPQQERTFFSLAHQGSNNRALSPLIKQGALMLLLLAATTQ